MLCLTACVWIETRTRNLTRIHADSGDKRGSRSMGLIVNPNRFYWSASFHFRLLFAALLYYISGAQDVHSITAHPRHPLHRRLSMFKFSLLRPPLPPALTHHCETTVRISDFGRDRLVGWTCVPYWTVCVWTQARTRNLTRIHADSGDKRGSWSMGLVVNPNRIALSASFRFRL